MKLCSKCRLELSTDNFRRDKNRRDGLYPTCKNCLKLAYDPVTNKARMKLHRETHREEIRERDRRWCKNSPLKRKYTRDYLRLHPDRARLYRLKTVAKYKAYNSIRSRCVEKECSRCKSNQPASNFTINNSKRTGLSDLCRRCATLDRRKRLKYESARYRTDINYRIKRCLRARLYSAVKSQSTKSGSTLELLGCSIEHLRIHLESLFSPGMTWDNQGQWHIDHIVSCATFNLEDPMEQRKCFHYTNLQPLWAFDNISKGAN